MFEAMDSSGSALQLLTQYPSAGIESTAESRVESVLSQEDDRVEKAYYYLAEKR